MGKFLRLVTPLLGVVFIALLIISARTMGANRFSASAKATETPEIAEVSGISYQYAFFLPVSDNPYFAGLKAGALKAAQDLRCAVIFHSLTPEDSLSLEMASYAGANGVAVFSYEKNDAMTTNLEKLLKKGVPIVQLENEVVSSPATVLIGTNSYDSGKAIGKIAAGMEKPLLNIALIYSDKNPSLKAEANLVEIGLKSTMGDRLSSLYTGQTTFNPIDAEGVIYELLERVPAADVIALTDSNDTLVAIQAIIDLNLVGRVQIIGFGDEQTIKEYIDIGVVLGSIDRRPSDIGYRAVVALTEINNKGNTSAYVNAGIDIITRNSGLEQRDGGVR